jgi:predicted RecB family endonuclease
MVYIVKKDGNREKFDEQRLLDSLINAGADQQMAEAILTKISRKLFDGITTTKIYRMAFKTLKKMDLPASSRYQVKWALMRLGDHGYPFEHFMERVLQAMGFETKANQILQGKHITHEVDVLAKKGNDTWLVECKHHSHPGTLCNIQTALYVYARFLDLKNHFNKVILVTNTRFSDQSKAYANGVGMELLGWRYPPGKSLERVIREVEVFPLTTLQTVKKNMLRPLLDNDIVTVAEVAELGVQKLTSLLRIRGPVAQKIIDEAKAVVSKKKNKSSK